MIAKIWFQLLNGGMKEGGDKPASMSLQPALPNAPTENDLIASKCCGGRLM